MSEVALPRPGAPRLPTKPTRPLWKEISRH